jgi:hypothetical protein
MDRALILLNAALNSMRVKFAVAVDASDAGGPEQFVLECDLPGMVLRD